MFCPFCGCDKTEVKDTRTADDGSCIRRRRHCQECMSRFTTVERVHLREMMVKKKEDRVEPFDREKLTRAVRLALHKRPVSDERIDKVVTGIVRQLEASGESEIDSQNIGEMVMEALLDLDSVAYVRYASIYKDFHETKDFETLIGKIEAEG